MVVKQEAGKDGAVAHAAGLGEQPRGDDGAQRVAHLDDLAGLPVVLDVGDVAGGAESSRVSGVGELAQASERGERPEDVDLDGGLHDVVRVGLVREAGAEPVVSEDGVAGREGRLDVRVGAGAEFGVPVSGGIVS